MRRNHSFTLATHSQTAGTKVAFRNFLRLEGSFRNLFWALFGLTELDSLSAEDDAVTQNTGQLLFGLYNITAILVSLNMLIAMMANTFQQVAVRSLSLYSNSIMGQESCMRAE